MPGSLFIENAHLWTNQPGRSRAASLFISGGRVRAIDLAGAPDGTRRLDAGGRWVGPGFIDGHIHLLKGGQSLGQIDLRSVDSREAFEEAIVAAHRALPPDRWLIAHGWSSESWGGEAPDASWLRPAGDRPVVCYRMDLHAAVVNNAVLQLLPSTETPPGGRFDRDAAGKPTGLAVEAAVWKHINPLVPKASADEKREAVIAAQRHVHSHGITAVGTMEYATDVADVYLPLRDQLTLRCAVTLLDRDWPLDLSFGRKFRAEHGRGGTVDVIGYKAFIDGTLGSRTARMLRDYADDPGNRGMLVELAADGRLNEWARLVAGAGFSPAMHAIGDEAVRMALDASEHLSADCRPRIEHAQQIDEHDLPRFARPEGPPASGRPIASMQPLHKADDGRYAAARLGAERLAGFFPFRRLLDTGAVIAFGSDWPVVSCDPIEGMRAAITGRTLDGHVVRPEENLSVEEALRGYTSGAAHALQMDDAGTLHPGAAADVVILDTDPFTADWSRRPPRVVMTIAGGRVMYDVAVR